MTFSVGVCSLLQCAMETRWYNLSIGKFRTYQFTCSWRRTRRAAHEVLTKVAVRDYHPILKKEAIILGSAILESPDGLDKHIQRSSASAIMSILYDYPTLESEHDEAITKIHAFIDRMSAASAPGSHLVELFPWMIHIPERYLSVSSIVCLITYGNDMPDSQSGSVKQRSILGSIRRHSMGFWTLCPMIS